jgi:hypothetical protein
MIVCISALSTFGRDGHFMALSSRASGGGHDDGLVAPARVEVVRIVEHLKFTGLTQQNLGQL